VGAAPLALANPSCRSIGAVRPAFDPLYPGDDRMERARSGAARPKSSNAARRQY